MSSSQSNLEQINYKQMRLMKSLYDDSYDKAEEFIDNRGYKKEEPFTQDNDDIDEEPFTQNNDDSDEEEPFTQDNEDSDEEPFTQNNDDSDDNSDDDFKEGVRNRNKKKKTSNKKTSTKKSKSKPKKKNKLEPKIEDEILKSIGASNSDTKILKDALSVVLVIGLTQISWKNIIHKTTGAVETTAFDKMIIMPIFNKMIENIKYLMAAADAAKNAYSIYTDKKNIDINDLGNLASSALGTNNDDIFDINKWSTNGKVTFWLILYIPLLWLSRLLIGTFSDTINWFYKVKWPNIFNWLIFGKSSGDKFFPDLNLYSPPKNPWLITVFTVYLVYLAFKVFIDYMDFWVKIPVFFVIFLCIWFGAVMFPFLNICIFLFFVTTAAYTLLMPLNFYYDNGKLFPHSFMDTLNSVFPDIADTSTKKFLDLTYRVFILLSAIIFIYKSFTLSSPNLKIASASISAIITLVWLAFTWNDLMSPVNTVPSANAEPVKAEPVKADTKAEPIYEPANVDAKAEPIYNEPVKTEPIYNDPVNVPSNNSSSNNQVSEQVSDQVSEQDLDTNPLLNGNNGNNGITKEYDKNSN